MFFPVISMHVKCFFEVIFLCNCDYVGLFYFFKFFMLSHLLALVSFLVFKKDCSSARNILQYPLLAIRSYP